jgi:hypothetical protein
MPLHRLLLLPNRLARAVRPRQPCGRGRTFRPRLERLEERSTPAALLVSNLGDAGTGSLRQAILDANASPGDDTIVFGPSATGTIALTSALPDLAGNIDVEGPGADVLKVQLSTGPGSPDSPLFRVAAGAVVTVTGLTITDHHSPAGSGMDSGIDNLGTLTARACTVAGNTSFGVFNAGTLHLIDDTVAGNEIQGIANIGTMDIAGGTITDNASGGISNDRTMVIRESNIVHNQGFGGISNTGTITVLASTIANNNAIGFGGGLANGGTLTIVNSTIANNTCSEAGGGISNLGTSSIRSCTIAGNEAPLAGGIFQGRGMTELQGTLVAQNRGGDAPDVRGSFVSRGHNLIGDGSNSAGFQSPGDQVGTAAHPIDPRLGPLQDNGGPTPTMALLPGSPAIDTGDAGFFPATDQRGFPRPQDGNDDGLAVSDIGAFEAGNRNQRFLTRLYRDLLGRALDPSGAATWGGMLDQGLARRSDVARAIQTSLEYRLHQVRGLYATLLGRAADPVGLSTFVTLLTSGVSIDVIRAGVLGSAEYFLVRGGGTNAGFLAALYQDVLGRALDPAGQAAFGAVLAQGAPRDAVALLVLQSPESRLVQAQGLYRSLLGRAANLVEQAALAGFLLLGGSEEQAIASIVSSPEYAA